MRFGNRAFAALSTIILLAAGIPALAQGNMSDKIAALRPPTGAKVAIIVFEDLQCPDCARAAPLVEEVAKAEKVSVVRHDFPLPMHNYSRKAAIIARYFDTKSKKIGDAWRDYVFANQQAITPENLDSKASAFAKEHGTAMPFLLDPGGKFEALIQKDFALGQKIGIQHTPTIFVVSDKTKGVPFVEVVDRTKLSEMIEDMKNGK
ncbi:MAG: hypothetical protein JWO13_3 [Acidobacteriales bacterium]|nr:hypothetical protein [Terriglobales bacterium]